MDPRSFWTSRMEDAHAFLQRMLACPVVDSCEPLADLKTAARARNVEIDFPEGRKLQQFDRIYRVRVSLVPRLLTIAEDLLRHDLVLRVEDAYRTMATQTQGAHSDFILHTVLDKVLWETDGAMPSADLLWRRISVLTATVPKFANHTCGSAVDVSILHRGTGRELDRGGPYLDLSERTPMDSPFISREARRNRGLINRIFAEHGFLAYPYEFWHYSHGDADHALLSGLNTPAVYGPVDLDLDTGHVTTFPTPLEPLLTLDHVAAFLERRQQAGAS